MRLRIIVLGDKSKWYDDGKCMKQGGEKGSNIISLTERLRKLETTRDQRMGRNVQQPGDIEPLNQKGALNQARVIAARFSSIRLLAADIDRQQIELGQIPDTGNYERAHADYLKELEQARQLETDELEVALKIMFAGYNEEQTVFLNSKYVAYARAYLEKVDKTHKLPNMEL